MLPQDSSKTLTHEASKILTRMQAIRWHKMTTKCSHRMGSKHPYKVYVSGGSTPKPPPRLYPGPHDNVILFYRWLSSQGMHEMQPLTSVHIIV